MIDWNKFITNRDQIHRRYPQVWDLKLSKRPSKLLKKFLRPGMRLLDVGAGDRRIERRIREVSDVEYKSIDIDRRVYHDYSSLDAIDEQFDLIRALEVIVYLELEEGVRMLGRLNELLVHRGILILSTPNVFHPHRFWETTDHKVAYNYDELGGIILSQGFEILGIYRTFHASLLKYFFRRTLFYPFHRILEVDFARSVVFLAQRQD